MDIDRFINNPLNIEIFRKLTCVATTEAERKILFNLLADEEDKYFELPKARPAPP
jgi:hypothetical protein